MIHENFWFVLAVITIIIATGLLIFRKMIMKKFRLRHYLKLPFLTITGFFVFLRLFALMLGEDAIMIFLGGMGISLAVKLSIAALWALLFYEVVYVWKIGSKK